MININKDTSNSYYSVNCSRGQLRSCGWGLGRNISIDMADESTFLVSRTCVEYLIRIFEGIAVAHFMKPLCFSVDNNILEPLHFFL